MKMLNKTVENYQPFIDLVARYREITIEDIIDNAKVYSFYVNSEILTGFGSSHCSLCVAFKKDCKLCYGYWHNEGLGCLHGVHKATYLAIREAITPEGLLVAFNERADHIEEWFDLKNISKKK